MYARKAFFVSLLAVLMLPSICCKTAMPPEPPITMVTSGSMPRYFVATSCFIAVPAGEGRRVTVIGIGVDGEHVGAPMDLDEEAWKRFTEDVGPSLKVQGADPTKRLLICEPKRSGR